MLTNRKLDHIGLQVRSVEADARWYQEVMGFRVAGCFPNWNQSGTNVYFLENQGIVYEVYEDGEIAEDALGKLNHVSYCSDDIDRDYAYCIEQKYEISTGGIIHIPTYWENGIRFFKVRNPFGEEVEFCQRL